jgi:hypothetical protein
MITQIDWSLIYSLVVEIEAFLILVLEKAKSNGRISNVRCDEEDTTMQLLWINL